MKFEILINSLRSLGCHLINDSTGVLTGTQASVGINVHPQIPSFLMPRVTPT